MIAWALVLYYALFFAVPWGPSPGYERLYGEAPGLVGIAEPRWLAYALAMAAAFIACVAVSWAGWLLLRRDDARWLGIRDSLAATGWLGPIDGFLPFLAVGAIVYAALNRMPLYGVLAAAIPAAAALALGAFGSAPRAKEPPKEAPDAGQEPPQFDGIPYEPLEEDARRHAGSDSLRDTFRHSVRFEPRHSGIAGLSTPEPYMVSWVVTRDEFNEALDEAPEIPFGDGGAARLARAVNEAARQRTVAFLAEQVAGSETMSVEDRLQHLASFVAEHFEPNAKEGRERLPVSCLADRQATETEAKVLVLSMAVSLALPVSLWVGNGRFGMAVEGISSSEVLSGLEHFDPRSRRRFILVGAAETPDRIEPLSPPRRRTSKAVAPAAGP